jgi:hypothetical protein
MAVKGENSAFFGKFKMNLGNLKRKPLEIPKTDFSNISENLISPQELSEKQIEKQDEILEFLKNVTIEQAKTSESQAQTSKIQYRLSIFFTITAIIISLIPFFKDYYSEKPNYNESIINITENQSLLTEKLTDMSIYLLDLQNQVKTLEKQNEQLKSKKPLKK